MRHKRDIIITDLTYPISNDCFKYISDPRPILIRQQAGRDLNKVVSGFTHLTIRSHHGTHIDAPAHKIPNGKTIDEYGIEKFINNARLIDLTKTDLLKRNERGITVEDIVSSLNVLGFKSLKEYAEYYKKENRVHALLFYTGFCDEIREKEGKLKNGEKQEFEKTFPYFAQKAANYVIEQAPFLNIVGIDSFSVDKKGNNSESHIAFLNRDILILETLVNLHSLTFYPFDLYCVPVFYKGADAAQTRAYAVGEACLLA